MSEWCDYGRQRSPYQCTKERGHRGACRATLHPPISIEGEEFSGLTWERWQARIDADEAMMARARLGGPLTLKEQNDLACWEPELYRQWSER